MPSDHPRQIAPSRSVRARLTSIDAIVLLFAIPLLLVGCSRGADSEAKPAHDTTASVSSTRRDSTQVRKIKRPGIGVSRNAIIDSLSLKPYLFSFTEAQPVSGELNLLGTSRKIPRATLQLLGDPENLSEVALYDIIEPDSAYKIITMWTAFKVASRIDSAAIGWVKENFEKIRKSKSCFSQKKYGTRQWTISNSQIGMEGRFLLRVAPPKPADTTLSGADTMRKRQ